jgi:glycerol-3-phosphate dehydrogenase (NAD(P)+)
MEKVSVLGAGAWGTAIAALLADNGHDVELWALEGEVVASINGIYENSVYLPGVKLPKGIKAHADLDTALAGARMVVNVVPSHGVRQVFGKALDFIEPGAVITSASKGIEEETLKTPSMILADLLGDKFDIVALSGPSFAKEVSLNLPTAVSAASSSSAAAAYVQKIFSSGHFRVYTNTDIIGVELGGALKNVIAIASGISDGLKLGHNARAALITRGLSEMSALGAALGAKSATFSGLSGLGDLVLTCTGPLSRNYTLGRSIGAGGNLKELLEGVKTVAEGVKTSKAARALASKHEVDMPITEAVCRVLYEGKGPRDAVRELMERELTHERG